MTTITPDLIIECTAEVFAVRPSEIKDPHACRSRGPDTPWSEPRLARAVAIYLIRGRTMCTPFVLAAILGFGRDRDGACSVEREVGLATDTIHRDGRVKRKKIAVEDKLRERCRDDGSRRRVQVKERV